MTRIRAGVVGITGYTGEELLKILAAHDRAELAVLAGRSGGTTRRLKEIYPGMEALNLTVEPLDVAKTADRVDIVFLALPHRVSFELAPEFVNRGTRVIDLSADFRLNSAEVYERWYGEKHTAASLLPQAVYGLPELYRDRVRDARLVANPGCYPTTVLLGLLPALKHGLADTGSIIVDSKSGVSGAGRKNVKAYYESEHPNHRAYNIAGGHRHIPEMEQELSKIADRDVRITFTPHIIPVERGMLSAVYCDLARPAGTAEVLALYAEHYRNEPFVRVLPEGKLPGIRDVVNTNLCAIGLKVDERTGRLVVISAIDNLVKGAAGQAVQNMNIIFGLDEKTGLI